MPSGLRYRGLRYSKIFRDSALPLVQAYRDKVSIWRAVELRELLTPDMVAQADYLDEQFLPQHLMDMMLHPGRDIVSRLTEMDVHSYMLDDILVKVDRMSMAHSLEVRSPLLDHHVVELAAKMPTRMKLRGGKGKHALREVLRDKLPKPSIRKGKQGFSVPLRDWFRGDLKDLVNDYLGLGGYLPGEIFQQSKIQSILHEHRCGVADHARKIWLMLVFAAWHRTYQMGPAATTATGKAEVASCVS
jgi:asparagine synthase (glutamine-hydrolysing)